MTKEKKDVAAVKLPFETGEYLTTWQVPDREGGTVNVHGLLTVESGKYPFGTLHGTLPIDIYKLAGIETPELNVLSDDFLNSLGQKDKPNLQMGLLRRLLNDQIPSIQRTNIVQARKFSELLDETINRYTNRSLTTAEIIAELVKLAKQLRDDQQRHETFGLREDEVAFCDAVAQNDAAVLGLGDETLKAIARDLVMAVRDSATIDWILKDSVRAAMRSRVRRLLAKYDYPPDAEAKAVDLVLAQARLFAKGETT